MVHFDIYKIYKEIMSFSLTLKEKGDEDIKVIENDNESFPNNPFFQIPFISTFIKRDMITNKYTGGIASQVYGASKKDHGAIRSAEKLLSSEFYFGESTLINRERRRLFAGEIIDSIPLSNNALDKKRNFSDMWPIKIKSNDFFYTINLNFHKMLQKRTFFIPIGRTLKLMTINGLYFLIEKNITGTSFTVLKNYSIAYITALKPHSSNLLDSIFSIRFENSDQELSRYRYLYENTSFNQDIHDSKITGLKLNKAKDLNIGVSDKGVIVGNWTNHFFKAKEKYYKVNYEILDDTQYNYEKSSTEIGNSLDALHGYIIPYSFSGELKPKAKFSFNLNLKDIYLTTSINVNRELLDVNDGLVDLKVSDTNAFMGYRNNYKIPRNEIDLLFKKNDLKKWGLDRWKYQG